MQSIEIFVEERIYIISKWDHLDLNVLISILMTQIFAYIVKVVFVINHLKTIQSAKWHWLFLIYIIICRVDLNLWVKKPQSEHNEKLNLNKSRHWTIFKRWNKWVWIIENSVEWWKTNGKLTITSPAYKRLHIHIFHY